MYDLEAHLLSVRSQHRNPQGSGYQYQSNSVPVLLRELNLLLSVQFPIRSYESTFETLRSCEKCQISSIIKGKTAVTRCRRANHYLG